MSKNLNSPPFPVTGLWETADVSFSPNRLIRGFQFFTLEGLCQFSGKHGVGTFIIGEVMTSAKIDSFSFGKIQAFDSSAPIFNFIHSNYVYIHALHACSFTTRHRIKNSVHGLWRYGPWKK